MVQISDVGFRISDIILNYRRFFTSEKREPSITAQKKSSEYPTIGQSKYHKLPSLRKIKAVILLQTFATSAKEIICQKTAGIPAVFYFELGIVESS